MRFVASADWRARRGPHRWECYFEPLSPCSELDAWQPYTVEPREAYFSDYNGYFYNADTQVRVGGMHAAARHAGAAALAHLS